MHSPWEQLLTAKNARRAAKVAKEFLMGFLALGDALEAT